MWDDKDKGGEGRGAQRIAEKAGAAVVSSCHGCG